MSSFLIRIQEKQEIGSGAAKSFYFVREGRYAGFPNLLGGPYPSSILGSILASPDLGTTIFFNQ